MQQNYRTACCWEQEKTQTIRAGCTAAVGCTRGFSPGRQHPQPRSRIHRRSRQAEAVRDNTRRLLRLDRHPSSTPTDKREVRTGNNLRPLEVLVWMEVARRQRKVQSHQYQQQIRPPPHGRDAGRVRAVASRTWGVFVESLGNITCTEGCSHTGCAYLSGSLDIKIEAKGRSRTGELDDGDWARRGSKGPVLSLLALPGEPTVCVRRTWGLYCTMYVCRYKYVHTMRARRVCGLSSLCLVGRSLADGRVALRRPIVCARPG